jgi:hypothetical protein
MYISPGDRQRELQQLSERELVARLKDSTRELVERTQKLQGWLFHVDAERRVVNRDNRARTIASAQYRIACVRFLNFLTDEVLQRASVNFPCHIDSPINKKLSKRADPITRATQIKIFFAYGKAPAWVSIEILSKMNGLTSFAGQSSPWACEYARAVLAGRAPRFRSATLAMIPVSPKRDRRSA